MTEKKIKNEHLTIMFTDIKGFTSKTSLKSREELHRLLELHETLIKPIFAEFKGRVIKTIGDAFLVTYKSPTDALLCGMKIQDVLKEYNKEVEESEKIEVRIAINSGEVSIKNKDIFGEPVNIASRIEGIAEANEIYFTESVYLSMNKNEIPSAEIGLRHLKGIVDPIKVYKVLREKKEGSVIDKKRVMAVAEENAPKEKFFFSLKNRKFKKILKYAIGIFIVLLILTIFINATKNKDTKDIINDAFQAIEDKNPDKAIAYIEQLENRELNILKFEDLIAVANLYQFTDNKMKVVEILRMALDKKPRNEQWQEIARLLFWLADTSKRGVWENEEAMRMLEMLVNNKSVPENIKEKARTFLEKQNQPQSINNQPVNKQPLPPK